MNPKSARDEEKDTVITFHPQMVHVGDTNVLVRILRDKGDIKEPKVRFLTGDPPYDNEYIKEIAKDVDAFQIDVYINILDLAAAISSNKIIVENGDGKTFTSSDVFKVVKKPK